MVVSISASELTVQAAAAQVRLLGTRGGQLSNYWGCLYFSLGMPKFNVFRRHFAIQPKIFHVPKSEANFNKFIATEIFNSDKKYFVPVINPIIQIRIGFCMLILKGD